MSEHQLAPLCCHTHWIHNGYIETSKKLLCETPIFCRYLLSSFRLFENPKTYLVFPSRWVFMSVSRQKAGSVQAEILLREKISDFGVDVGSPLRFMGATSC
jgi:hypothetical protein